MSATKSITELEWRPHPRGAGRRAVQSFENGYSASCLWGEPFYTSESCPYEIAVISEDGNLDYTTSITNDVLGYLTESEANAVLAAIAALPPKPRKAKT